MSNSLDPVHAGHFVDPDLDPNYLQRLSTVVANPERVKAVLTPS